VDIRKKEQGSALVISLAGSLDTLTAGSAQNYIGAQFDRGQHQIVLDLDGVSFMSSSGLRLLVNTLKRSKVVGGSFRLASVPPNVRRTLEISGLERILDIYRSVEEAVSGFDAQGKS
jgi:anti-sigma B factor antagonist